MKRKLRVEPGRLFPLIFLSWLLIAAQVSCVKLPRRAASLPGQNAPPIARPEAFINLNTATLEELEKLPGIGQVLAGRIIEHRERYGPFRRAEHLMMVRGISERRFRSLSAILTAEQ
jgi:competence ComEA-like helix-hairpin-helix protein